MNKSTKLFLNVPEDAAAMLIISQGDYTRAKRSALKLVMAASAPGGLYALRRHYCAVYVHLLLNDPGHKLLPHFSLLK